MTKSERLRQNKDDVISMYKSGNSTLAIGKKYDCNHGLVHILLTEFGVEIKKIKRYSKATKERYDCLIEYMSNNLNYGLEKIANQLNLNISYVSRVFKRLKIDYSHRVLKTHFLNHQEICELYKSGLSMPKIAEKLECSEITIFDILKKNGIESRPLNKYEFKRDIIDNGINTPDLAYMWGLWLTDGNVMKDRVRLSMCDRDVIEKMKNLFEYTGPIYTNKSYSINHKDIHELNISNVELAQKFISLGCIPNKTHSITFPTHIPNYLLSHFIRGLMDGDGSIRATDCSLTGNWPLLEDFIKITKNKIGLADADFHIYCRHPKRNNQIKTVMLTKKSAIKPLLDWLYKDSAESTRMNRKYNLYIKHWANRVI